MKDLPAAADAPEFNDSDQQWFDRLTGKVAPVTDAAAVREADVLRRMFQLEEDAPRADPELDAALTPQAQAHSWQQLQFRLRREQASQRSAIWRRRTGIAGGLAAAVLVAVVLVQRPGQDKIYYDEPPTLRGEVEITRLADTNPKQAAEALAEALRGAGLRAGVHQQGNVFSVDARVTPDTPAAAVEVLRGKGVSVQPGIQRVEFAPR